MDTINGRLWDQRAMQNILKKLKIIKKSKHTGNKRLFLAKTFWCWWRWIHFVCFNFNDMSFVDCFLRPDWQSFRCKFFTRIIFNENGKKCSLEIWQLIDVFIAFVHITISIGFVTITQRLNVQIHNLKIRRERRIFSFENLSICMHA